MRYNTYKDKIIENVRERNDKGIEIKSTISFFSFSVLIIYKVHFNAISPYIHYNGKKEFIKIENRKINKVIY